MTKTFKLNIVAVAIGTLFLTGCGDAETTIIEKDPIEAPDDGHDHGDGDGFTIESMGRLAVLSAVSNEAAIYDLDKGDLLDSFSLIHDSNTLAFSADYRFAVITNRTQDYVGFIDGGLWREDHVDHLHDYQQSPAMSDYELAGSRPTHIITHDGQLAVFFDGDAQSGMPSSVQVVTDSDISSQTNSVPTLNYSINMHGVAEPRGEHVFASVRRDDVESSSANKVLPDQIGVYHLQNDAFELEKVLDVTCPDLHGAAQNDDFVIFGCSDGTVVVHQDDSTYQVNKVPNAEGLGNLRIGTIYGHEESSSFIGIAAGHGGGAAILLSVNPEESEMETLEWQPEAGADPVSYAFSYEGEHFLVLDSQGFLNILSHHEHDGHTHWELEKRLDISEEDISTMPEGMSFSMTVAQNGHYVYVSDPIAQHVLQINLESLEITSDVELDFAPANITWLGIAEEAHSH